MMRTNLCIVFLVFALSGKAQTFELRQVNTYYGKIQALQDVSFDVEQGELVGYEACRLLQLLRGEPLLRGEVLLQVGQLNHKPALQAGPAVGPLHHAELGRHAAEDEVHVPGMAQLVLPARVEVLQEALTVAVAAHAQALSRVCGPPLLQGF